MASPDHTLCAVSKLSDRLADAKGDRSIDDIVERAAREGHQIDRSAVARYIKGDHGPRPAQSTLAALAAGLGLDVRELRKLAGKAAGERDPYVPTPEAASLTLQQRRAMDQLIRAIVAGGSSDGRRPEDQKSGGEVIGISSRRRLNDDEIATSVATEGDPNEGLEPDPDWDQLAADRQPGEPFDRDQQGSDDDG